LPHWESSSIDVSLLPTSGMLNKEPSQGSVGFNGFMIAPFRQNGVVAIYQSDVKSALSLQT
jgi:hypothetical protein